MQSTVLPPGNIPSRAEGSRLLAARYGRRSSPELMQQRIMAVPGGHCSFFGDVPALNAAYRKYLTSIGFIS